MKNALITVALYAVGYTAALLTGYIIAKPHTTYTGNEWSMRVAVPPCAAVQNVQVIWPAQPNGAITIECDNAEPAK